MSGIYQKLTSRAASTFALPDPRGSDAVKPTTCASGHHSRVAFASALQTAASKFRWQLLQDDEDHSMASSIMPPQHNKGPRVPVIVTYLVPCPSV